MCGFPKPTKPNLMEPGLFKIFLIKNISIWRSNSHFHTVARTEMKIINYPNWEPNPQPLALTARYCKYETRRPLCDIIYITFACLHSYMSKHELSMNCLVFDFLVTK